MSFSLSLPVCVSTGASSSERQESKLGHFFALLIHVLVTHTTNLQESLDADLHFNGQNLHNLAYVRKSDRPQAILPLPTHLIADRFFKVIGHLETGKGLQHKALRMQC